VELDPFAKRATFLLKASLTEVDLVRWNDFLNRYAKFDVKKDTLSMYTEIAAADGILLAFVPLFYIRTSEKMGWMGEK
jgi:hypothetical protein